MKNAIWLGLERERARTASQGADSFQEIPSCSYRPYSQRHFLPRTCTPHSWHFFCCPFSIYPSLKGQKSYVAQVEWIKDSSNLEGLLVTVRGWSREAISQILCPTKKIHSLKGLRKQCIQWTVMIADGRAGSSGPIAWTQPVEDETWSQRTSARGTGHAPLLQSSASIPLTGLSIP